MFFNEVLQREPDEKKQATVRARLLRLEEQSSVMLQMHQNLYTESRIEEKVWQVLIDALCQDTDPESIESTIRKFCQERLLKGPITDFSEETLFSRAIPLDTLARNLWKLGYYETQDQAEDDIRLHLDVPPAELPESWKQQKMGCYLLWSTFDPEGGRAFGDSPPPSAAILCSLGLDPISRDSFLLLLEYRLTREAMPRIPTFCDAYASPSWTKHFRPASPQARHGRTITVEPCPLPKGRPEVVHEVISVRQLVAPIRVVS